VIPSAAETAAGLYGSYRLARLDPSGMRYFNVSVDGFWRSFFAAVLVAPMYAVFLTMSMAGDGSEVMPTRFALAHTVGYVVGWLAYPAVMESLTRLLGCRDRFIGYIVAYNWASVLRNAVVLPIALLPATGLVTAEVAFLLWLGAFLLVLAYVWFIARVALGLPGLTCAALVVLDLTLGIFIDAITTGMR